MKDYDMSSFFFFLAMLSAGEPLNFKEAMSCSKSTEWKKAVDDEYRSLMTNNVWELVERPKDQNVIKCKWVFKKKIDANGNLEKYIARLVARGFTQRYGVDYKETFAPVVRYSTLRLLFAIGVEQDMDMEHIDVSTAFLNGNLSEKIYLE
jgi:hypothetical protein